MVIFTFTREAEKRFLKLPKTDQGRIFKKLKELKKHTDILSVMRRLSNFEPATHRLRIGHYRLILELRVFQRALMEFWVLDVGHRKDIYK